MNRLSTGYEELDQILGGGFPENSINIIMGMPGTGKTITAESIIFHEANEQRKALYLSTVSEPLDKMIRYLQDFSFFKPELIGSAVIYEDLADSLRSNGLNGALKKIRDIILREHPKILVIDSFKALHPFASSPEHFRTFLSELSTLVSSLAMTSFWVGEYAGDEISVNPEFAVADGIIELVLEQFGVRDFRYLRVMKMRGSNFFGGQHGYRITADGLNVFPRLTTAVEFEKYDLTLDRLKTGVEILDAMTGDGFWRGSSTAIFGPSGSGKTLICLHAIIKGIEMGDPGLIFTMQENPTQLARIAYGFGWDLQKMIEDGKLQLIYVSPIDIDMDESMLRINRLVRASGTRRVMIDSLNDLENSSPDPRRFRDYMYAFVQSMAADDVTCFMTNEIRDLFGTGFLSEFGISHMADNIVLLHYLREQSEVKRAISILKTRASAHDSAIRQFIINTHGIKIGEAFSSGTEFRSG